MQIGFLGLLGLLLIALKLIGYVTASWWLVLAPLWVLPLVGFIVLVVSLAFAWRMS